MKTKLFITIVGEGREWVPDYRNILFACSCVSIQGNSSDKIEENENKKLVDENS